MNDEIAHLVLVRMHENDAAIATRVFNRVAGLQHGRGADHGTEARCRNHLQRPPWSGHLPPAWFQSLEPKLPHLSDRRN
jgi:hypothetical protein